MWLGRCLFNAIINYFIVDYYSTCSQSFEFLLKSGVIVCPAR